MNKRLLILLSVALSSCSPCPAITPAELDKLIPALEKVESGGIWDAIGDGGKAVGILQLWPEYVEDVNRISGKAYRLSDRYSPAKSREMTRIYLAHYGKTKTIEQTARIHNGGPNGYKKAATLKYWEKVKKELSK